MTDAFDVLKEKMLSVLLKNATILDPSDDFINDRMNLPADIRSSSSFVIVKTVNDVQAEIIPCHPYDADLGTALGQQMEMARKDPASEYQVAENYLTFRLTYTVNVP